MRSALAALLALLVVGAALAQAGSVTMTLTTARNVNGVLVLMFAGTVSSGAAGEEVEVVGQDCGGRGFRALALAETRPGGGWQVQNPEPAPTYRTWPWHSGMTFRARWEGRLSEPVVLRFPARIYAERVRGRRAWRVSVYESSLVPMKGKVVELQRRTEGGWARYRRGRLVHKPSLSRGAGNNEVTFQVAARGLTLRAFLPRASALPCFLPAATAPWRT